MSLTELFRYIVYLSLLGSVMAIGIFSIKLIFRQKLSANWHYYIWLVLVLRLVIPFTPTGPFSMFNLIPQQTPGFQVTQAITQASINPTKVVSNSEDTWTPNVDSTGNRSTSSTLPRSFGLNWTTAALAWLFGVLVFLSYICVVNGILFYKLKKRQICTDETVCQILEDCRLSLQVRAQVSVYYDDSLRSPSLIGFFRPMIIISPKIITLFSSDELHYIFLHELSHLKRRDLLVNTLVTLVQVVYWFNPLTWFALHQMKQDCEMACDATALAIVQPQDRNKYGLTIIRMLELLSMRHWAPGILGFANKINKRRIMMISSYKKTTLKWAIAVLALTAVVGCSSLNVPKNPSNSSQSETSTTSSSVQSDSALNTRQNNNANGSTSSAGSTASNSIVYNNRQYGFSFTLPESWQGYSVVSSQWKGTAQVQSGETTVASGPIISLRDPKWTSKAPRQDIPIMVFTLNQWTSLQQGVFHIGAAPIGPSELGHNNNYVFALPARYNYAFPPGYKEVETILASDPLKTAQTKQLHPDAAESLLFNMMVLAEGGKVINSDFAAKTNTIDDVKKIWGNPDTIDYVPSAKGTYATYTSHSVVFGINKGDQIFEVRSYDSRLKGITLATAKRVLGTPAYDVKVNDQQIVGYVANSEFKVEMAFPLSTNTSPTPVMDHYNVLYPSGTVNSMANDPGRQW